MTDTDLSRRSLLKGGGAAVAAAFAGPINAYAMKVREASGCAAATAGDVPEVEALAPA